MLTITPRKQQKMMRDIINEFVKNGHRAFVVCPCDDENPTQEKFVLIGNVHYLFVNIGNTTGRISIAQKIKNLLLVDKKYKKALRTAIYGKEIGLILYSTPPVTLVNTIGWAKKTLHAKTYLMLKDIFPQNAVDMGMMKKSGPMGFVYQFFRRKEKKLYGESDFIGCMSPANCRYILSHNPEIPKERVGICVNSYCEEPLRTVSRNEVRRKYGIPNDKTVFLYGGNLGKPQGLDYLVKVLRENKDSKQCFFVLCGGGNDQKKITDYILNSGAENVIFMNTLPPDRFDELTRACDVGLVFLDNRFTIPNFPSRMLSIMLNAKPILAATDKSTDVNEMIQQADCGWWCESTDTKPFNRFMAEICANPSIVEEKGRNARAYYESHFTSEIAYRQIIEGITKVERGTA